MIHEDSDDHAVAARAAEEAGRLLVELRRRLEAEGADSATMRDEGDRQAHELLVRLLERERPDDAVLSEEGKDDPVRLSASRVWIVDPLDGTREYGEVPRDDWAVHVALARDGLVGPGAVALPAQAVTYSTAAPPVVPPRPDEPVRLVVSRSRPPAIATALADALDGVLVEMGSAGAKTMAILQGRVDVYAHAGGQYEWDSAAPVAVAQAAGLHVSRIDGSPLRYNNEDPYLPDLLVCRSELADEVLALVAKLSA